MNYAVNALVAALFVAIVIERVLEQVKIILPKKGRRYVLWALGSFIGIVLAIGAKIGFLSLLGVLADGCDGWVRVLDYVLTGLVMGGGSGPVHDVFAALESKKEEIRGRKRG